MATSLPKVFALLGPTASGKTSLALSLAEQFPIEVISLDSALIYRDMNIGTAKPSAEELQTVPHHLINIISPLESYSAAQFVSDCVRLVKEIHARGHLPLLVGGTMMYYHALTQGLNSLPEANTQIRAKLDKLKQQHGMDYLYAQLKQVDPITAARLPAGDSQRIERALEIYHITGIPMSSHLAKQESQRPPVDVCTLALFPADRAHLRIQIASRFHSMLTQGFVEEVEALRLQYPDLHSDLPSIRCVGYRQAFDYLNGLTDYNTFVERGIVATRQLAKRQLTWLRKLNPEYRLDPFNLTGLHEQTAQLIQQFFA
ncbi:tRNA (adenosine(37)-N6)-dimethylallyltransferase MiaA [Snodgrassella alvi]|uniref:tRNA dimethylallyltransferase n=1 Tax=Snodgrassella alvi TaxID=1196083 RepID=A0A2N9Y0B3_9NEIS|nr:tRNA (adenosine(37)-N6)-dimethylallyltransferase MiaA [Snodgrassella alvi]PIT58197.1 tRNA (adenosine(37)-N6)-dimethylallyltransferase MiaA [Snodgrassella alvi]